MQRELLLLGAGYHIVRDVTTLTFSILSDLIETQIPELGQFASSILDACRIPETFEAMRRAGGFWTAQRERTEVESLIATVEGRYAGHRSAISAAIAGKSTSGMMDKLAEDQFQESQFCERLRSVFTGHAVDREVFNTAIQIQDYEARKVHLSQSCHDLLVRRMVVQSRWESEFAGAWVKWFESAPWSDPSQYQDDFSRNLLKVQMALWLASMSRDRYPSEDRRGFIPIEIPEYLRKVTPRKPIGTFLPLHISLKTDFDVCPKCRE